MDLIVNLNLIVNSHFEFFDALAIKQFRKENGLWFEKYVNFQTINKAFLFEKKINIKKIEKKINFKISDKQNFIEYSELGFNYLRNIAKMIKNLPGVKTIAVDFHNKRKITIGGKKLII